jgi:hypothetical protein
MAKPRHTNPQQLMRSLIVPIAVGLALIEVFYIGFRYSTEGQTITVVPAETPAS